MERVWHGVTSGSLCSELAEGWWHEEDGPGICPFPSCSQAPHGRQSWGHFMQGQLCLAQPSEGWLVSRVSTREQVDWQPSKLCFLGSTPSHFCFPVPHLNVGCV